MRGSGEVTHGHKETTPSREGDKLRKNEQENLRKPISGLTFRVHPKTPMTSYTHIDSPLGRLLLTSRQNQLTGLYFADKAHAPRVGREWVYQPDAEIFAQTKAQLDEYASGENEVFDVPVAMEGTPFQVRVWNEISMIPFGHTITYTELAHRVGALQAVRAVGTATGANRISWIIPCHRVVGKRDALTGYAGGLERKKALLDFEAGRREGRAAIVEYGEPLPDLVPAAL